MSLDTDIIIVGAGPAGLSFCRSLADSDLRLTVIESHSQDTLADPPFDGREIALTHPSKANLESLGIWQHFAEDEIYDLRDAKVTNGDSPYSLYFPVPDTTSKRVPIDTLGYLVSNHNIRKGAYQACANQANINWLTGEKVSAAQSDSDSASVTLASGQTLRAKLVVAADSRFSFVRRAIGIPTDMHDFGRTVMVFRLNHTISNDHTAFECFFYGSTLALLPLSDYLTNCVVTIDSREAPKLQAMNPEELAQYISDKVEHRYGEMTLASTVHDYPLMGVHARRFHANRCALVGDAACGMHPVTAHGFNLGLQSQAILSRLILRQHAQGKDIADPAILSSYTRQHMKNTRIMYHGTNFVVKLFTNESRPAKFLRDGLLRVSNNLPPLKTMISRQLTG